MIIASKNTLLRIKKPRIIDHETYTVILFHNANKTAYVLDVSNSTDNALWYRFEIEMPDDAEYGEYTYYIIEYSGSLILNCNHIPDSTANGIKIGVLASGLLQYINVINENQYNECQQFTEYDRTR